MMSWWKPECSQTIPSFWLADHDVIFALSRFRLAVAVARGSRTVLLRFCTTAWLPWLAGDICHNSARQSANLVPWNGLTALTGSLTSFIRRNPFSCGWLVDVGLMWLRRGNGVPKKSFGVFTLDSSCVSLYLRRHSSLYPCESVPCDVGIVYCCCLLTTLSPCHLVRTPCYGLSPWWASSFLSMDLRRLFRWPSKWQCHRP